MVTKNHWGIFTERKVAQTSFLASLAGLAILMFSVLFVPYAIAEANAETASAKTAWGTISLTLDPDVDATTEYNNTSGASGSQIGDAGHGDVEFGALNPTAKDTSAGSYGTLRVLKKTIGVSTTGKYYTVYLSMSKKDINGASNNNGLNLVTSTSGGSTVATDSGINLPAIGNVTDAIDGKCYENSVEVTCTGTFENPTTFSGPGWGFAVPNANTTGNIATAGNFLTSYYTATEINVSSDASGAANTYNNSLWSAVPTADSPVQIWKQTTTNNSGFTNSTFDIYYAVAVDTNTLAGTYENNVVYTAVANTAEMDKASTNLLRDKAFGGAGDTLTINFDLTNSTAYLEEDDITITLVPHSVMVANNYDNESTINITNIASNATNLDCPIVTGSLDLSTGSAADVAAQKTTSIQCTVPTGEIEDGTGAGTYDIWLKVKGYNYNYVSVYQYGSSNSLVGAFIYAGLQSQYANMDAGATYTDARYIADTPIVTKMQEMTPGICAQTNRWNTLWGDSAIVLDPDGNDLTVSGTMITTTAQSIAEGVGSFPLKDTRDGKRYIVRRMGDGNCWMAQNLDLNLYSGMTLSSDDTNISEDWTLSTSSTAATAKAGSTSTSWQATHGVESVTLYKGTWDSTEGAWAESRVEGCGDSVDIANGGSTGTQALPCYAKVFANSSYTANSKSYWTFAADGTKAASTATVYDDTTTTGNNIAYAEFNFEVRKITYDSSTGLYGYTNASSDKCTMYVSKAGQIYDDNGYGYCRVETTGEPTVMQYGDMMNKGYQLLGLPVISATYSGVTVPTAANDDRIGSTTGYNVNAYPTSAGDFRWRQNGDDGAHVYEPGMYYYSTSIADEAVVHTENGTNPAALSQTMRNCSTAGGTVGTVSGTLGTYEACLDSNNEYLALSHNQGNWYNWYAATAGRGTSSATADPTESICPKGWQLPTGNQANKSFYYLITTTMGLSNSTFSSNKDVAILSAPLSFTRSGVYDWGYVENTAAGPRVRRSLAYYWSSTRSGGNSYDLYFASGSLDPQNSDYRGWGFTLRCVAQ